MEKTRLPVRRSTLYAIVLILIAAGAPLFSQSYFSGTEIVLANGVIDLRENPQFRKNVVNKPGGYYKAEDLKAGSIFIDVNNTARKVVCIYEDHGKTVIETRQPRMEEVVYYYELPDQQITLTRDNIDPQTMHAGVTLLDGPAINPSIKEGGSKWLETDEKWMGRGVISVKLDIPIWTSEDASKKKEPDNKPSTEGTGTAEAGDDSKGKDEGWDASAKGEVYLRGILRIADPILKAGSKAPVMRITWVRVWWYIGYPKIEFENGYLHASINAAQQLDCKLTGNVHLEAERIIPLYGFAADKSSFSAKAGVYIKISVEGDITVQFEISEYTDITVWGTVDLFWPFIPIGFRTGCDMYYNFAARPSIYAEAEAKSGVYIGFGIKILGLDLVNAETGGGLYAEADGYLQARGIVGFNRTDGGYGNWNTWRYEINFELGAYVEGNLTLVGCEIPLFEEKWPFLRLSKEGEI